MSNYDLRAREWNQRMKAADTTQGEPLSTEAAVVKEDPSETSAYLNTIYPPAAMGPFWSKEKLLELAANLFVYGVPFPPRMRSDFIHFRVTPDQFEARTYLMLLMIDIENGLPEEAKRPEVYALMKRWQDKPSEPITRESLEKSTHLTATDKSMYMQLYDVPLKPKPYASTIVDGKLQPSGRARILSQPIMDTKPIESDPKNRALLDSVHAGLLGANKLDPFAHHEPSLRSAMISRPGGQP